jgi:hypothetical protein
MLPLTPSVAEKPTAGIAVVATRIGQQIVETLYESIQRHKQTQVSHLNALNADGSCGLNYRLSTIGEDEYIQCGEQTLSELANQRGANGPSNTPPQ